MCGFDCIAFIEYMLARKTLSHYTRLFSRNDFIKNDKIIHTYFKDKYYKRRPKLWLYFKKNETRNYFLEEIKQCIDKKHKKTSRNLNYVEHLLILASIITV